MHWTILFRKTINSASEYCCPKLLIMPPLFVKVMLLQRHPVERLFHLNEKITSFRYSFL